METSKVDNSDFFRVGLITVFVVLLLANGLIALFTYLVGPAVYVDWIGTLFICATPIQIMMGVVWQYQVPAYAQTLPQPLKGLVQTGVCFGLGAVVMALLYITVGQGVMTPILVHCSVQFVCVVAAMIILFGGWPMNKFTDNPVKGGLLTLALSLVIAIILFSTFYNYDFMAAAPFYEAVWDPAGMFNAINALTFSVTAVAGLVMLTLFELWPVTAIVKDGRQPLFGIVGLLIVLAVASLVFYLGIYVLEMDPLDYMVRVAVSGIFGAYLVDNIMQFRLFEPIAQPFKGFIKLVVCSVLAVVMYDFYEFLIPYILGSELSTGPEANYAKEIWMATAMLAITFPVINVVCDSMEFWPIKR